MSTVTQVDLPTIAPVRGLPVEETVTLHEGSHAFEITKTVRLDQLEHELCQAMNWRKDPGLTVDGDLRIASAKTPVTIFVHRDDLDPEAFRRVVTDHKPDAKWVHPKSPTTEQLVARVRAGEPVTQRETLQVLQRLLGDESST